MSSGSTTFVLDVFQNMSPSIYNFCGLKTPIFPLCTKGAVSFSEVNEVIKQPCQTIRSTGFHASSHFDANETLNNNL